MDNFSKSKYLDRAQFALFGSKLVSEIIGEYTMQSFQQQLVDLLKRDARLPISTLAETLHTSRKRVKDTIERLVDIGVIKRFTIEVDESADTKPPIAIFFHIRLKQPKCAVLFAAIKHHGEIVGAWSVSSSELDLQLLLRGDNLEQLEAIRDEISAHPLVQTMHSNAVLKTWRD